MKVSNATQIFSGTVAAAVKTVIDTKRFKNTTKEIASSTASFIGKMDKIFDCFNSSQLYSKNPYKSALKLNGVAYEYMKYFKTYLEYMHFVSEKKKVYLLDGMKQTCNGVLELCNEFFPQNNIYFLMTRAINQDKLENAFSVIRQKEGNNIHPSVAQINIILARLLSTKLVKMSSKSNCEELLDDTCDIVSHIIKHENLAEEPIVDETEREEPIEEQESAIDEIIDEFENADKIGTDNVSLRYFLGYVAYKMKNKIEYERCAKEIIKNDERMTAPSELFIFHKNYNHLKDFGSLLAPSDIFFKFSNIHVSIFNEILSQMPQCTKIKEKIKETCILKTPLWFEVCREHKIKLLDFLVLLRKHCVWASRENKLNANKKLKILNN